MSQPDQSAPIAALEPNEPVPLSLRLLRHAVTLAERGAEERRDSNQRPPA